jgi:hypothetical protein
MTILQSKMLYSNLPAPGIESGNQKYPHYIDGSKMFT